MNKENSINNTAGNSYKEPFILIGLTPQGLSMLRFLSRIGFKVIAFTDDKTVGYYSKYGDKYIFKNIADLKLKISNCMRKQETKIKCIITSGKLLSLILSDFPELYEWCEVQSGPYALVKMLSDKSKMYKYATDRGLTCAKFSLLCNYKKKDIKFPVILKLNNEVPLFFKVKKLESEDELSDFKIKIDRKNYKNVLIQEYIDLSKFEPLTYQAFYSNGIKKGFFVGVQKRRLMIGITSFLMELQEPELIKKIDDQVESFFKGTDYTGFAELEFLYDYKTDTLIFMEINTRVCGTNSALISKFINLESMFKANPIPSLESSHQPIVWINILRDIKVRILNKDFKNLTQFFTSKYDVWDIRDLKPFFYQLIK